MVDVPDRQEFSDEQGLRHDLEGRVEVLTQDAETAAQANAGAIGAVVATVEELAARQRADGRRLEELAERVDALARSHAETRLRQEDHARDLELLVARLDAAGIPDVPVEPDPVEPTPEEPTPEEPTPTPPGEAGEPPPGLLQPELPRDPARVVHVVAEAIDEVVVHDDYELHIVPGVRVGRVIIPAGVSRVLVHGGGEVGEVRIGTEHQRGATASDVTIRGITIRTPAGPHVHGILHRCKRLLVEDVTIYTARYCVYGAEGRDVQFHRCTMASSQEHNMGEPVPNQAAFRLYDHSRVWITELAVTDPDRHSVRFHGTCSHVLIDGALIRGGGVMLGDDGAGTPVDLSEFMLRNLTIHHEDPPANGGFLVKPHAPGSIRLLTVEDSVMTGWSWPSGDPGHDIVFQRVS